MISEARKMQKRAYREKNKEAIRAYMVAWRQNNHEHLMQYAREYRESHAVAIKASKSIYREVHKQQIAEQRKQYRQSHQDSIRRYMYEWRRSAKEHLQIYTRQYRKAHPEWYKAYQKRYGLIWRACNRPRLRYVARDYYRAHSNQWVAYRTIHADSLRRKRHLYYVQHRAQLLAKQRDYLRRHPEGVRKRNAWRRARKANVYCEQIDRGSIIERDRGLCWLCQTEVALRDVSLDHVVPLSLGGPHTEANLRLAHRGCNSGKRDRIVQTQLRLI